MAEIREKQRVVETSEAQIAVHWREEEYYYPSSKFIGQANLTDPDVLNRPLFLTNLRHISHLLDLNEFVPLAAIF